MVICSANQQAITYTHVSLKKCSVAIVLVGNSLGETILPYLVRLI